MAIYDGPVIDAHHHFWEPALGKQPWLLPQAAIDFRYGPYDAIKRSYLPADLRRDAADVGLDLVGSVTMETEWDLDDPIGEMRYNQDIAQRYGMPQAAVAHAVLHDPGVERVLEALAQMPIVRGVRHKPGQAPSAAQAASHPSLLTDPQWRAGFALLDRYGLSFDLQTAWWQMDEAYELLKAHPEQLVVINHAALPNDRSAEGIAGWTRAISLMASLPQVAIKVSGIGLRDVPWTAANNRVIVETITEHFGPERMMFASNFPVDSLTGTYAEIYGGFLELTDGWPYHEQLAAFAGNAVRLYRLDPALIARA